MPGTTNAKGPLLSVARAGFPCVSLSLALAVLVVACHRPCLAEEHVVLVGTGSTVPAALYANWSEEYNKRGAKIQMRYLPLGTSGGIEQISRGNGDFAAGEVLLTAQERAEKKLIQLPTVLIAIVPIYNVPGVRGQLRFSGALLADIFLGRVKTWNSRGVADLNPDVSLPDLPIKVVYRPAGKGSNYVFTEFLSKSNPQFKAKIGISASPTWPVGVPAERSADMAEKVAVEAGSIGYVELRYALRMRIPFGSVLNPAGHFVEASQKTLAAACEAVEAPGWQKLSASLTQAPGPDSYPISSFSWLYLRATPDVARRTALADLLNWMMKEGQQIAAQQGYVELPSPLLAKVRGKISSLR